MNPSSLQPPSSRFFFYLLSAFFTIPFKTTQNDEQILFQEMDTHRDSYITHETRGQAFSVSVGHNQVMIEDDEANDSGVDD